MKQWMKALASVMWIHKYVYRSTTRFNSSLYLPHWQFHMAVTTIIRSTKVNEQKTDRNHNINFVYVLHNQMTNSWLCRYYRMIMNYKYRKYRIKHPAVDFVQLRSSSEPAWPFPTISGEHCKGNIGKLIWTKYTRTRESGDNLWLFLRILNQERWVQMLIVKPAQFSKTE